MMHNLQNNECIDAKIESLLSVATDNKKTLKRTKHVNNFDSSKKVKIYNSKISNNSDTSSDDILPDVIELQSAFDNIHTQKVAQLVFKHVIHTTPGLPFALAFGWAQESFVESDMYRIFDHHLKDGISPVQFLYRLWDRYRNLKDYRGLRHLLSLIEFLYDSCNVDIFKNNIKDDFIALIHDFITYMNDLKDEIKKEFKRGMLEAEMAAKRAREADEDARVAEIEAKMKAYAEQLRSENEHSDDEPILTSQAIVDESEDYDFLKFFLITLKSGSHLLDNISDKINDKLWIKLYDFVARICVFFTRTLCQQNVSDLALPDLIIFVKSIFIEGADIVSTIFKGVIHLFENLPKYLRGEDTIFCGVDRSRKLESTAATLRSLTSAVLGGDEKTLLQEGYTISSYLIALDEAIKDCTDACNTVKSAQRPYLSNLLYTLKDIKNKIDNAHLQQVTRPEPFAIALFGKSGVGKSTITPKLAKIMIMATGEQYNDKLVVTGDINDKYDSVETSRHKCIIYDDVGNSVNKVPDFDKVLTAINSQPRMFNKSEAQEKGKHFPSNTSTIITSNVVGLNAYKTSVEPQSILRRFDYHILTEIWDPRVKAEGTDRIDPILISKLTPDDKNRIWTFKVYKFVTFDPNMIKEDMSGEDKASLVRLNNNPNDHSWYKLVKTFDGSKCDSLDHLEAFLGRECKIKYDTGYNRVNVDIQQEPKCTTCFHKESSCICTFDSMESQGFIRDQAHKFLHNICDIKDLSWSSCYSYKLNPFYYMEIIKLCYIAQYADAENYIRIKCEQMDNHLDNKFESIRLYWWRYIFIHSLTFFTKLYFQNFMYFIFGLISVTGIIGKLYSWFIAFIFLLITSCITIRIIYFIQCIKMSDYAFYEQVTLPRKGEFKKYRVTQKVVTSIACLTAFYAFYRVFLSGKQQVVQSQRTDKPYSETEVRSFHKALPRSNKARCTNSSQFEKIMDTNIARVIINYNDGSQSVSNTCNLDSNMFVITGHSVPKKGTFDLTINYMKENSHLIAHEKLSAINDVYRVPGRDLCMIQVPSCQPRKSLKDYLPYGTYNEDKPCLGRNAKFVSSSETLGCQILNEPPKWVPSTEAGRVNVETYIPQSFTPEKGDCGSAIISPVTSNIVGFHIGYLKKLNRGAFQRIFRSDLENAKKYFERTNFLPHSMGELHKGNIELSLDCENATHLTSQIDPSVNLPLDEHNLCVYGANPLAKFSAKNYYRDHPYKSSVESVFGPEKYSPPVKINSAHHKRKALTKLASPNQDFVKQDVIYAVEDYLKPIFDFIDNKSPEEKSEYGRVLSDQETLDGIPGQCLNGINNHTSVGFPYKGKKSKYLLMDEDDPNVPIMPRTLQPYNGVDMQEEMANLEKRYLNNESGGCIFKASMKTNELLPNHKIKGRVFMGCNFPFLMVVRKYLGGIIQLMGDNRFLFEMGKGIDMNGIDAHHLREHLAEYSTENVIALDYSAFDQTMSAQVSTQASFIIIKIMERLGMSDDAITIAKGALTDMNYPHILFDGTIISLGNSNPSGQPLTTELNGIVNSLYLRILFFGLYPKLKYKKNYKDCVRTMTYGDDNISAVLPQYLNFNGETIVAAGKKVGLTITMADKDAKIVKFTKLDGESDFLKRTFRYCSILKKYRAPISMDSLKKRFYYMPLDSPLTAYELFMENIDDAQRSASLYSREIFIEYQDELKQIAQLEGIYSECIWYDYDELLKQAQLNLEPIDNLEEDEELILESQSLPIMESQSSILTKISCSVICIAFVAYLYFLCVNIYSNMNEFRLRLYSNLVFCFAYSVAILSKPLDALIELGYCRYLPNFYMLQINALLSKSVYVSAGRANEIKETTSNYIRKLNYYKFVGYSRILFSEVMSFFFPYSSAVLHYNMPAFSRQLLRIDDTINNLSLTEYRDIIRKQPFGLMLTGPAGSGKTFLTHALINALYSQIGGINPSEVVTLNENDEFQSEFRSSHKVVIFDDIANNPPGAGKGYTTSDNPFIKVIDFINNISKAALNPSLESKGKVLIKPDLVIATSNLTCYKPRSYGHLGFDPNAKCSEKDQTNGGNFAGNISTAFCYASIEPQSLYRRFLFLHVEKNPNWVKTKPGFDSTRYKLYIRTNLKTDHDKYVGFKLVSFDVLLSYLMYAFIAHHEDQDGMVKSVNSMYDEGISFNLIDKKDMNFIIYEDSTLQDCSSNTVKYSLHKVAKQPIFKKGLSITQSKMDINTESEHYLYSSHSNITDFQNNILECDSKEYYEHWNDYPLTDFKLYFDNVIYNSNGTLNSAVLNYPGKLIEINDNESCDVVYCERGNYFCRFDGVICALHHVFDYNTHNHTLDSIPYATFQKFSKIRPHNSHYVIYRNHYNSGRRYMLRFDKYIEYVYNRVSANCKELHYNLMQKLITEIEEYVSIGANEYILESQSDVASTLKDMTARLPSLWRQFYSPPKRKPLNIDQHILKAISSVPLVDKVLLPEACGVYPIHAEEQLNLQAQAHFKKLGWNIVAYECTFNGTSCDLLICKPSSYDTGPVLGVVECKVGTPEKTMAQVITRMQELQHNSVVGFAYSVNRITFIGSVDLGSGLQGIISNNDIPLTDKCSDHKNNGNSYTHKRVLELRSSGQLDAQE